MLNNLTKTELYAILAGIFTASLIISNTTASKTFEFSIFVLPCSILIFPIVYIVDDVLAEVYSYRKASQIILLGFFMNLVAVIYFNIILKIPTPPYFEHSEAYSVVLGSAGRLLLASFMSYLAGSLLNAKVMVILKEKYENKLFFRCILSTIVGGGLDASIFIFIGFYGTMPLHEIVVMILGQVFLKAFYETLVYPITRYIINSIKALPES
jgi:hypothetical protein